MASCELRLHKNTRRRQQCIGIIVFSFVLPFFFRFSPSGIWQCRVAISIVRHSFGSRPEFNETFRRMDGRSRGRKYRKKKTPIPSAAGYKLHFSLARFGFPNRFADFPSQFSVRLTFSHSNGIYTQKKKSIVYINICSTRLATKETSISNIANEIYFFIFFLPFLSCILSLRFSILESFLRVQISQAFVLRNELN